MVSLFLFGYFVPSSAYCMYLDKTGSLTGLFPTFNDFYLFNE